MTEKFGGKVVEAGFRDGNDNPENTSDGGLLEKKLQYFVDAGPEYKFIHSSDAGFRHYLKPANVYEIAVLLPLS